MPAPPGFERERAQQETLSHLRALIALDTQNPPGNELLTARYLESVFGDVSGIETHVIEVGENRANFIARVVAPRAEMRPVLVLGHMDVVGAQAEKWDTPPFEPTFRDGYLYGRGAIDDKGMLAATTTALLALAGRRDELTRDVILLATAAEEGGEPLGIDLVLEQHRDLLRDAEFALNEGGRIRIEEDGIRFVAIQTTEKVYYDVELRAVGPSGHGSVPLPDNALAALARAVARVHEWRAPVRLNETTRLYFESLARIEKEPQLRRAMLELVGDDPARSAAAADLLARDPLHNAVLRSAQALTILAGGFRSNVIPSEGRAVFNLRVMPGDDVRQLVAAMEQAAEEPPVRFSLRSEPSEPPPVSPVATDLYRALETVTAVLAPGAVVMPFMSTGATDGAALRRIGIPTYGILPFPLEEEDQLRMHGDNERVPVPALSWGAEFMYRTLARVASP